MPSVEVLQGHILEESLAYLVRRAGFTVIDAPDGDDRLALRGNGLVVRGRGAEHQIDVLGELEWAPAFTYPLRLALEAKFRQKTTGIPVIRNQVAALLDINQNYNPAAIDDPTEVIHSYVGAVCSTSGFSKPARELALAHQISVVDLSADDYAELRQGISTSASRIYDEDPGTRVQQIRDVMRAELGTPRVGRREPLELDTDLAAQLRRAMDATQRTGELFLAMGRGPFLIVLKADDREAFIRFAEQNPTHEVAIHWTRSAYDDGQTWRIQPLEDETAYTLRFRLPQEVGEWVFSRREAMRRRALTVKQRWFSRITILRQTEDRDWMFTLKFEPERVQEG